MRLFVLRYLSIWAFTFLVIVTKKDRFRWMLHYLKGSGASRSLPAICWEAVHNAILNGGIVAKSGEIVLNHSTLYPKEGFWHRPESFYLVGGFSFTVEVNGETTSIRGEDAYDWHPNRDGDYFTSPMNPLVTSMLRGLSGPNGHRWFPKRGFPSGEPGISNAFWQDLQKAGAIPFTTFIYGEREDRKLSEAALIVLSQIKRERRRERLDRASLLRRERRRDRVMSLLRERKWEEEMEFIQERLEG